MIQKEISVMKRCCKEIDITDPETIYPYVFDCIHRHARRYDFRRMLFDFGLSRSEYKKYLDTQDFTSIEPVVKVITSEVAKRIRERRLDLPPVVLRDMLDRTTGKERQIGKENPLQQVFDYVAVGAAGQIWKRRIVPQQFSSIKDRGQIYGARMIRGWIKKDNKSLEWSIRHDVRYSRKCKYYAKLDIKKCFPSMRLEVFMKWFSRDCGNPDLLWLWRSLLESHRVQGYKGFMIGALPSQWGAQYLISFVYRYVMNLKVRRRGRLISLVSHMGLFMDDMCLFGSSRKSLKQAIKLLSRYAYETFGLLIKDTWSIYKIDEVPLDMMGYVFHSNGKITIRGRDFIRARRIILIFLDLRSLSLRQSKRLLSYKGYFKYSDCRDLYRTLKLDKVFSFCAKVVSIYAKRLLTGGAEKCMLSA